MGLDHDLSTLYQVHSKLSRNRTRSWRLNTYIYSYYREDNLSSSVAVWLSWDFRAVIDLWTLDALQAFPTASALTLTFACKACSTSELSE